MIKASFRRRAVLAAALLLVGFGPQLSLGAQKVPISFDSYHGYEAAQSYLKKVARAYPDITKLIEIGKSTMGRSIFVLAVSNMKTGEPIDRFVKLQNKRREGVDNVPAMQSYQAKPGHWICGATHGNEFTGTEVCLYTIDKLVSGYGSDETITERVDKQVFYICPVVNPDGLFNSLDKGLPQRQNSMKKDDDGDGTINEDGLDDLNSDGRISQFRYKDPEGQYILDEKDPRVMIRLGRNEKTDKERYSVIMEDKDNDGDGKRGEDSERGIDLNRNWQEGWFTDDGLNGGTGDYPTSSPEVHAVVEFLTNHTNVLMAQYYHTSGGFTYRAMGTAPHNQLHPRDVAVFDLIMGKKYLEIIGEEVPQAWINPASIPGLKEKLKEEGKNKYAVARGYELPRGWRVSYNEERDRRYGYGMATDWMYKQYGAYSITTELWNPARDIVGFPTIEGEDARLEQARALIKIQEEKFGGKLFLPWKKFKHPDLGEGEIGGWIANYRNNAWPGQPLLTVCENHWRFELFRSGLQPEIVISEARARVLSTVNRAAEATVSQSDDQAVIRKGKALGKYKIIEVTAVLENKGQLPTHLGGGAELPGNRQDVAWLIGDRAKITPLGGTLFQQLGVLDGAMKIPGVAAGRPRPGAAQQRTRRQFMPYMIPGMPTRFFRGPALRPTQVNTGGAKRTVKWLVAIKDDAPLKVVVTSQKGGTAVREVTVQ
jgi:hypothetical protein